MLRTRALSVMFTEMDYEQELNELIILLDKAKEDHWARYFRESLNKYNNGHTNRSYKHVMQAYGGMGSFNDIILNFISDEEYSRVEEIRESLWQFCKSNKSLF